MLWQWGAGHILGAAGPRGMSWHTRPALGATTRALGAPTHVRDAVALADPKVSLGPWQLRPGPSERPEGSPPRWLQHGERDLPGENPTHQAGETDAEPAVLSEGRGIGWQR